MGIESPLRRPAARSDSGHALATDRVPLLGRFFPAPVAANSDYLKNYGNLGGGGTEVALFVTALVLQFATRRYRAFAYWYLAYAIATAGTGISDFLHLDVHIAYIGTTVLWTAILAAVFWTWQRSQKTLSIHSITTQRREAFYWATVFATFALGTAVGDFTAASLNMGYLPSGIFFLVLFLLPAVAWLRFGLNGVAAFWMSYIVTRPLGASFSDYISKPSKITGINFGNGPTALVLAVATVLLVLYLAIARPDIQRPLRPVDESRRIAPIPREHLGTPELGTE